MKIVVCSAMHGRREVVEHCLKKLSNLDVTLLYGYTDDKDGELLSKYCDYIYQCGNNPLSHKFQLGIDYLKHIDFDMSVMIGSDDYFDQAFLDFIIEQSDNYDFIAFKDIYFEHGNKVYYWSGYTNHRKGEPCGAGKAYSKRLLEALDYTLYHNPVNRGLDGLSWKMVKSSGMPKLITSLKDNGLYLADIKTGESMTPLHKFKRNSGLIGVK